MIRKTLPVTLLLALACSGAWAQSESPTPASALGPSPYGNGERPRLNYSGVSLPRNLLSVGLNQETAYDDNVLNDNSRRRSDAVFVFGGAVAFRRERKRLTFATDYQPHFLLYRETRTLNTASQSLGMDLNYQFSPRFAMRTRESFHLGTGGYFPLLNEKFMPELDSPARMNDTVLRTPVRTVENNLRLDALYQKSSRTSFDLFGSFLERDFLHKPVEELKLRDNQELNTGLQHLYRLDANNTIGTLYLFQNLRFVDQSRTSVHGAFFSFARRLSPGITVTIFGGPQYTDSVRRVTADLLLFGTRVTLTGSILRSGWHAAGGGVFSWESDRTALQLAGRRTVTDGGGLLIGAVTNTVVDLRVRRRIGRLWHALGNVSTAQSDTVVSEAGVRSQSAGFGLERSLTESLTARFGYNFIRQRTSGQIPLLADIDRNRLNFGLSYRLGQIKLGR